MPGIAQDIFFRFLLFYVRIYVRKSTGVILGIVFISFPVIFIAHWAFVFEKQIRRKGSI
jgi:hypothetical protein